MTAEVVVIWDFRSILCYTAEKIWFSFLSKNSVRPTIDFPLSKQPKYLKTILMDIIFLCFRMLLHEAFAGSWRTSIRLAFDSKSSEVNLKWIIV